MASRAWTAEDRKFLERLSDRRDWIVEAVKRFPDRSEAAIRCMMQKVRCEQGATEQRFFENAWMVDAVNGSRALLAAIERVGVRP